MLLENNNVKIQLIDAECDRMMKVKIGAAMEIWQREENNLDKWQNRLLVKEKKDLDDTMDWGGVE